MNRDRVLCLRIAKGNFGQFISGTEHTAGLARDLNLFLETKKDSQSEFWPLQNYFCTSLKTLQKCKTTISLFIVVFKDLNLGHGHGYEV